MSAARVGFTPSNEALKSRLAEALLITREFLPAGLSNQLDDATIASKFPGIVGALVVAGAVDKLSREASEIKAVLCQQGSDDGR